MTSSSQTQLQPEATTTSTYSANEIITKAHFSLSHPTMESVTWNCCLCNQFKGLQGQTSSNPHPKTIAASISHNTIHYLLLSFFVNSLHLPVLHSLFANILTLLTDHAPAILVNLDHRCIRWWWWLACRGIKWTDTTYHSLGMQ